MNAKNRFCRILPSVARDRLMASTTESTSDSRPTLTVRAVAVVGASREKGKVGYEINFNRYFYQYTPPRPLEEIEADLKQIEKEIADIAAKGVDDKTLGEVLSHARYAFAAELSTPDHVALVGAEFLALDGRLSVINDYFSRLAQVKSADVQRVARAFFTPPNRTVVTLQPEAP